jgi:secreted protein with Ig-like and vWFA domain
VIRLHPPYPFDAVTFVPGNHGFGPNLFYYLRHDANSFSTFGTINPNGAVTDRFGVGNNFDALSFAPGNQGYGPNLFYYLRRDVTGLAVTAPDENAPNALAQQGYYMLFPLNNSGVPSTATWLYLQ